MGVIREWWQKISSVTVLLLYIFIILSTLHVAGKGWIIAVNIIGDSFYKVADLIIFTVLAVLFLNLILHDVFRGRVRSVLRYIWLIALAWAAIATLYEIDDPQSRMHMPEYLIVGFLAFRAAYSYVRTRTAYFLMVIVIFVFAITEEYLQLSIPGRTFELFDLFIDFWSVLLSIMMIDFALSPKYIESMASRVVKRFVGFYGPDALTSIKFFWYEITDRVNNFFTR